MSEDTSPSEKEHEASQKKLDDAREKGEIVRSADLTTAAGYAGFLLAALAFGPSALMQAGEAARVLLDQADRLAPLMLGGGSGLMAGVLGAFAGALAPFFLLPALAALLMVIVQRALIFTPTNLIPKLNRVSLLSGVKNKFGRKGLFEFAKSLAKLVIIGLLLGLFLVQRADEIMGTLYLSPALATAVMLRMLTGFLLLILMIAAVIGGIDYFWQRGEHLRQNRMSRKDMQDEQKNSDGDPHMKAARRQRAYDIATNQMLADVPSADVVIVNPTHFAVALKWDRTTGRAPICLAKGVDEIAARIRERAAESGVPLHSDPPTARALHAMIAVGQEVPRDHYRAVAAAIRFAEKMRKLAKERGQR